jgi:hypothetical protein
MSSRRFTWCRTSSLAWRPHDTGALSIPRCRRGSRLALRHLAAGAQLLQQLAEQRLLVVGEVLAEARVVADGDRAEAVEERLARGRELGLLRAPVALLAPGRTSPGARAR